MGGVGSLAKLRALAPVTFICMHGSPLSRINNLDLWQTHDYKALGIVGEPYLDGKAGSDPSKLLFLQYKQHKRWAKTVLECTFGGQKGGFKELPFIPRIGDRD